MYLLTRVQPTRIEIEICAWMNANCDKSLSILPFSAVQMNSVEELGLSLGCTHKFVSFTKGIYL